MAFISRLEYDEESNTISGYNRTGENFEFHYANLMQSSDKYFWGSLPINSWE